MNTPEFLLWSLERACTLRELIPQDQPEKTERHLRSARAYSDAVREGRVFEGLCVAPPMAFRVDEALAIYGGLPTVESVCYGCPANALAARDRRSLAGCYGMLPLPADESEFHAEVEQAVDKMTLASQCVALFPSTSPRWYGLWKQSPLSGDQLTLLLTLLRGIALSDVSCRSGLEELLLALDAAVEHSLPLHVQLYPRGESVNGRWLLNPHCGQCAAPWNDNSQHCAVCGHIGHPASPKKRHSRGTRPYFALSRLMGEQQSAEFLARYETFRNRNC